MRNGKEVVTRWSLRPSSPWVVVGGSAESPLASTAVYIDGTRPRLALRIVRSGSRKWSVIITSLVLAVGLGDRG